MDENILLNVDNLTVTLPSPRGPAKAVDGISFTIAKGETFALLGESGCGKSMTALALMQLLPSVASLQKKSTVDLSGTDLLTLPEVALRRVRGRSMAMIFQEPMTSLNPVMTIGAQIQEVLKFHHGLRGKQAITRCCELLEAVGLKEPHRHLQDYPHQFSGGMKQRVVIAIALAGEPDLLIADEPTTALDVTIQAQILELLKDLQKQTGMALLLITHDLGVVKGMADEVAVMYAGHIVEQAKAEAFFIKPQHPYSQMLFAALPSLARRNQPLSMLQGQVPALGNEFTLCRFAERCEAAVNRCKEALPSAVHISEAHAVRCHLAATSQSKVAQIPRQVTLPAKEMTTSNKVVLHVEGLKVHFPIRKGLLKRKIGVVKAVAGIDIRLEVGKTLAIVGESGCGKTTLAKAILRLLPVTSGDIKINDILISRLSPSQVDQHRADFQIVFQDPYSSMDPRMIVREILLEGLQSLHPKQSQQVYEEQLNQVLRQVGLPTSAKWRYPHEFSGGQRQRICIARALLVKPKLLVLDEPTSALDVSVQAQILNLLRELQQQTSMSYLFITHNIGVVAYIADDVVVMREGKIVEYGDVETILTRPQNDYTKTLLESVPEIG